MDTVALHQFMSRHRYGVVSSTALDGTPQSALVGIAVASDLVVVFDTVKTSRKYPNLVARPRRSFVIGWDGEQTVQLQGDATEPRGLDLQTYRDIYFAAWADGPTRMSWPEIAYFVVRPRWIRYSDYGATPPEIVERTF